jgi:hypothetical protein
MKLPGVKPFAAALAALALPIAAGWLIHRAEPPVYEAVGSLLVAAEPASGGTASNLTMPNSPAERDVLTPEVIARTLDLLEARQIAVTPDPVRLSLSDTLLDRLRIDPSVNPGSQEVVVRYRTAARDEAATVLAALLDAVVEVSRSQSLTQEMTAASAADEAELAQFDDAVARQRLLVNAAQSRVQEFSIEQAALRASQEKLKSLGQAAAEVQRRRIEAESRFRQAEQDVASGIPAELLAARLPAGELRTVVTELFAREDRRREIAEGQARLQQLAKVYGRNHPALQEVQTRLQQLAREVADEAADNCCWKPCVAPGARRRLLKTTCRANSRPRRGSPKPNRRRRGR